MGLGGGIIAMNRQAAAEDAYRRRHHQPPLPPARRTTVYGSEQPGHRSTAFGGIVNIFRNLFGQSTHQDQEEDRTWPQDHDEDHWAAQLEHEIHWPPLLGGNVAMPPPPFPKPKVTVYEPSYTHPGTPPPGFTWDFAEPEASENVPVPSSKKVIVLDEDEAVASSSSQSSPHMTATLVCARCMDPLVLPAQAASAEENKTRRLWALRCGHILDGKCITHLMQPQPACAETVKVEPEANGAADVQPLPVIDRKGKGKAVDRPAPYTIPSQEEGSIRSRLRPRRGAAGGRDSGLAAQSTTELQEVADVSSTSRTVRPLLRRAKGSVAEVIGAPTKGKGRKSRRQRHTWKCPVPDCGLEHVSVLPAGEDEWLMDPHKGALPMFV